MGNTGCQITGIDRPTPSDKPSVAKIQYGIECECGNVTLQGAVFRNGMYIRCPFCRRLR
jgi:hypothetical protein